MNANTVLNFLQKFHRELCLLLLVLFGLACGQLAATFSEKMLRPELALKSNDSPSLQSTNAKLSARDLNLILQQNIFDPTARGKTTTRKSPQTEPIKKSTRKDLILIGTLVSGADSTALIQIDREIKLLHLDEPLPGGAHVKEIHRNQVIIRNQDESTTLLSLNKESQRKVESTAKSKDDSGIRNVGADRWAVSSAKAEMARTNISEQLRLAHMEPQIINGQTEGFLVRKLYGNSLLTEMGIKRGDIIMRVNGMPLNSPEKAIQILQQLREARELTVDLERKNKPMTFSYEIN